MLLGIAASFIYHRLKSWPSTILDVTIGGLVAEMFHSPNFYACLIASPTLFAVVVSGAQPSDALTAVLLAFQNGFFWQAVLPHQ